MRRSVLPTFLRLTTLCSLAVLTSACSTTPDRYAFWRDDAPTLTSRTTTSQDAKPNLADVPAAPDVTQARADMQDLQKKLAADRDAAYRQAQNDKNLLQNEMTTTPLASISDNPVSTEPLPPVGNRPMATVTDMTKPQDLAGIQPAGAPSPTQPAMTNPNRAPSGTAIETNTAQLMPPAPAYPVYTPPSVQINPAARPYSAPTPTPDYVYGRSGVQFRQRMDIANGFQGGAPLTPPSAPSFPVNTNNITVDMSALGGPAVGRGAPLGRPFTPLNSPVGAPAVFFNHGSTRLSPQDHKTLSQLAASAKQNGAPVRVIGHASSRAATKSVAQAKAANLKISADRTAKVMQELARKGVKAERIEPAAMGDSGATQAATESAARRVDILIGQ